MFHGSVVFRGIDGFFEAIDSDDFDKAQSLMTRASVDSETIAIVLSKMGEADVSIKNLGKREMGED
jgi:hypothetical protein